MRVLRWCAVAITLAAAAGACTATPASPTPQISYNQTDVRIGDGTEATSGKVVTVQYTGWFYDNARSDKKGLQFDSSVGGTPLTFTLGTGAVIDGFDRGVTGMKIGGLRRLVIPPSLAYGILRNGPIPPSTPLIFDIELLNVQDVAVSARAPRAP